MVKFILKDREKEVFILTFMPYKNTILSIKVNEKKGISRGNIKYLVDKDIIEKSARGVYILLQVWDDETFNLQSRFKRGIIVWNVPFAIFYTRIDMLIFR